MTLRFPEGFLWGTSTAAAQVETASDHNWKGVTSLDGYVFDRTSDHEKRRTEDAAYIARFGTVYRCGVDWARLQAAPFADFDMDVVKEYQTFFEDLNRRGMKIMFVIHHFTNPIWFEKKGSWQQKDNIPAFVDYAKKCIFHFGNYTFSWNTFNEPNVYAINGWMTGNFPPMKKNFFLADKVLQNLAAAHDIVYDILQEKTPDKQVGISLNAVWFDGINLLGKLSAGFMNRWFFKKTARLFQRLDYFGISYYAYIPMNPFPITEIENPGELARRGYQHDKMWAYRPEGLERYIRMLYKWHKKPIIITENGICTEDADQRIASIKDYLGLCHQMIQDGIPLKGYIHWSTWDNFEWNLGPTYRFGLVRIDLASKDRTMTKAGEFYSQVCKQNAIEL